MTKLHVTSDQCYTVTLSLARQKSKNAKIAYLTSDKCHTVTPKRPKILKMQKLLNSNLNKYLCSCDTLTLCHTALCDIFVGQLKDGRRHGMDTYFFLLTFNEKMCQFQT
jgi:hypothetical protein